MENSEKYELFESKMIVFFHRILLSFVLIVTLLLIFLPINNSVKSNYGEIVSRTPQFDYISPFESLLDSIYVREGDSVEAGDTLMTIINTELEKNIINENREYNNLLYSRDISDSKIVNIKKRIAHLEKEMIILKKAKGIDVLKKNQEVNNFREILSLQEEKIKIANSKLAIDSSLYKNDVISTLDITNSYDSYLLSLNNYNESKNKLRYSELNKTDSDNEFERKLNEHNRQLIALEENLIQVDDELASIKTRIKNTETNIEFLLTEKRKLYILSSISGSVGYVFNNRKASSMIDKNALLISVSPFDNIFYAKLSIPQSEIWQIKTGQQVNLKVDAYYFYEHGVINGFVTSIPERTDNKSDFFIHVGFRNNNMRLRSGYSIKGEIIIKKMSLGKFLFKHLFKKVSSSL
jgi:multidrug efflux pump subunit AcrA (membrane-fusion protein)